MSFVAHQREGVCSSCVDFVSRLVHLELTTSPPTRSIERTPGGGITCDSWASATYSDECLGPL